MSQGGFAFGLCDQPRIFVFGLLPQGGYAFGLCDQSGIFVFSPVPERTLMICLCLKVCFFVLSLSQTMLQLRVSFVQIVDDLTRIVQRAFEVALEPSSFNQ